MRIYKIISNQEGSTTCGGYANSPLILSAMYISGLRYTYEYSYGTRTRTTVRDSTVAQYYETVLVRVPYGSGQLANSTGMMMARQQVLEWGRWGDDFGIYLLPPPPLMDVRVYIEYIAKGTDDNDTERQADRHRGCSRHQIIIIVIR